MQSSSPTILNFTRAVLKALILLNTICILLFAGVLVSTLVAKSAIMAALAKSPEGGDPATLLNAVRLVMLLGLLAVPMAHLLLTRLLAIVETVRAGEPFAHDNARRLTMIAWALLGLQLLDLAFGAVALSLERQGGSPISGWTFSLTGWLAVLLLFVLARAFAEGTRLQEEAEGTV